MRQNGSLAIHYRTSGRVPTFVAEMSPFRSSVWRLSDAHADDAFARLSARAVGTKQAQMLRMSRIEVDAAARPKTNAPPGFRYLGSMREVGDEIGAAPDEDVFVDADETTQLRVRRGFSRVGLRSVVYRALPSHRLVTLFADGAYVSTVGRSLSSYTSEGAHLVRRGTEDVSVDVVDHLAFVRRRAESGARIVPVRCVEDVVRIRRYFMSHVASDDLATAYLDARKNERVLLVSVAGLVAFVLSIASMLYAVIARA